jgi:hypothetical protein
VVLVVGSFHVDHAGGLYQRVRAGAPEAKVWRLSVVSEAPEALRAEDKRAGRCGGVRGRGARLAGAFAGLLSRRRGWWWRGA